MNWQILSSKYVFSNKELQNNTVKTAGLGDRIQAKHTQKKTILIWICTKSYFLIFLYNNSIAFKRTNVLWLIQMNLKKLENIFWLSLFLILCYINILSLKKMASIRKLSQAKPKTVWKKKIRVQQNIFHSKFYQNVSKNIKIIKKYFKNTNDFFI